MQGVSITDERGNVVRILDLIQGKTLDRFITGLPDSHEEYFTTIFPEVLDQFIDCVAAILLLHDNGEKHGDIRRDHILIDSRDGRYRWIDFDFNYRHRENIYGYDLFGLGNVLAFIVGKGDILVKDVMAGAHGAVDLNGGDINIVFRNRVVNLRKVIPYIPKSLNRILMHFSETTNRFYLNTGELLEDLREVRAALA
jgi:tRNA A-37 threonylcarbamoyl transferase component Bud32